MTEHERQPDMGSLSDAALTKAYHALESEGDALGAQAWAMIAVVCELRAAREEREREAAEAYAPTVMP